VSDNTAVQDDLPQRLDEARYAGTAEELPLDTRFELQREITPLQHAFLERNGFLVFSQVATQTEVDAILAEVARITRELVASGQRSVYGVPVWMGTDPAGEALLQRMPFTSTFSTLMRDFVTDERFEAVRRLIGEDARIGHEEKDGAVFNQYVNIEGGLRPGLAWHTDGLRDVFYTWAIPGPMLNVGLHFDRIRPSDGGLYLLPGTHEQSIWSTLFSKIHFVSQAPDPNEVHVETWPGDLTVHDGRMWHRVQSNSKKGWASLRRSMYVPYVCDDYTPKDEDSTPRLYHRLFDLVMKRRGAR